MIRRLPQNFDPITVEWCHLLELDRAAPLIKHFILTASSSQGRGKKERYPLHQFILH